MVVLGAGYAGLLTAKRLARRVCRSGVSVTLVNGESGFVERIRLHQVAAGQTVTDLPLARLLAGTGAELIVGTVTGIDLAGRKVRVGEKMIGYDTLVYSLGSMTGVDGVPGAAEHAVTLSGPAAARQLATRLRALDERRGTVVICGGGPTAIEAAAEFAESYPDLTVRMITKGGPGASFSPRAGRYIRKQLDRLGVEVTADAEVARVEPDGVALVGGVRVRADVTVWCAGFTVPALARHIGLAVDAAGRILVDQTLRSVSHPDVYAVGDAAAASGRWGDALAYGCRSGGFTGPYAADTVAARLTGRATEPFRFRYFHQCISLGRRRGLIQFVRGADDSPKWSILRGRLAALYKEAVSSSAVWLMRHPGPYLR